MLSSGKLPALFSRAQYHDVCCGAGKSLSHLLLRPRGRSAKKAFPYTAVTDNRSEVPPTPLHLSLVLVLS